MKTVIITLLVCGGCALGPIPVLTPHTAPIPHQGINLGPAWVQASSPNYRQILAAYKVPLTLRVPVQSAEEAKLVLAAVEAYPDLSVLLLVERPDLVLVTSLLAVKDHPQLRGFELGNELDLAGISAEQFGVFVLAGYRILREGGFLGNIISGGIYTVDSDSLSYLRAASLQWPADIMVGLHWYGDASDEWLAAVQSFARQIAVTEYGMAARNQQEELQQAAYLKEKATAFQRLGASFAIIYMLGSGPTQSNLDNFGILRADATPKRAAFEVLR